MSSAIEQFVNNYITSKNGESDAADGKSESDFPSDTVSAAREVDNALDKLKHDYDRLKGKIEKDSSLANEVEELASNTAHRIIKPF